MRGLLPHSYKMWTQEEAGIKELRVNSTNCLACGLGCLPKAQSRVGPRTLLGSIPNSGLSLSCPAVSGWTWGDLISFLSHLDYYPHHFCCDVHCITPSSPYVLTLLLVGNFSTDTHVCSHKLVFCLLPLPEALIGFSEPSC